MIRKVGGVPAAHVALHGLDGFRPGRPVVLHQEVAVLQQATAPGQTNGETYGVVMMMMVMMMVVMMIWKVVAFVVDVLLADAKG